MSHLEDVLAMHIRGQKLPKPEQEHRFHATRKWRFDFAWPEKKVAIEVEGGIWSGGRHTRGKGFEGDCCKYNTAALEGWTVLRVTGSHIKSGQALEWIKEALT